MTVQLMAALLTGAFGLGGVLGGAILTNQLSHRAEDQRRWLLDRRQLYAAYLALATSVFTDIMKLYAIVPIERSQPMSEHTLTDIAGRVTDIYLRSEGELRRSLEELQLLAGSKVADLAERTSWTLYELNAYIDVTRLPATEEYLLLFANYANRADSLVQDLRNAMRLEIGLPEPISGFPKPENPGAAIAELDRLLNNFT